MQTDTSADLSRTPEVSQANCLHACMLARALCEACWSALGRAYDESSGCKNVCMGASQASSASGAQYETEAGLRQCTDIAKGFSPICCCWLLIITFFKLIHRGLGSALLSWRAALRAWRAVPAVAAAGGRIPRSGPVGERCQQVLQSPRPGRLRLLEQGIGAAQEANRFCCVMSAVQQALLQYCSSAARRRHSSRHTILMPSRSRPSRHGS